MSVGWRREGEQTKGPEEKGGSPSAPFVRRTASSLCRLGARSRRGSAPSLSLFREFLWLPFPLGGRLTLFSNERNKARHGHKDSLPLINTMGVPHRHRGSLTDTGPGPGGRTFWCFLHFRSMHSHSRLPPEGRLCGEHLLTVPQPGVPVDELEEERGCRWGDPLPGTGGSPGKNEHPTNGLKSRQTPQRFPAREGRGKEPAPQALRALGVKEPNPRHRGETGRSAGPGLIPSEEMPAPPPRPSESRC